MSFLAWAKNGAHLCIGTVKGNILLYNHQAGKKIPIIGKHSKRITCGMWSHSNLLALGAEDRTLTISTIDGEMVHSTTLRAEPSQIQFGEMKKNGFLTGESTVVTCTRSFIHSNFSLIYILEFYSQSSFFDFVFRI